MPPFFLNPRFWRALPVYGGSALLVIAALGLTTIRLLLPQADEYRPLVERQMSRLVGQTVRIAHLDARLQVLSPTLVLSDVQLLDEAGRVAVARFQRIQVGLAPFDSLMQRQLVLKRLTVVGSSLTVERRQDGSFHVQGLSAASDSGDPEAMGRWLLSRQRINLRDSHLVWRDVRTAKTFTFEGASLELRNQGQRHQLSGELQLPRDLGGKLRVEVDMEGDPLVAGGLRGDFYVAADQMRPKGLLRIFPIEGIVPGGGDLEAEIWGNWEGARLVAARGRVQGNNLAIASKSRTETLSQLNVRFHWERGEGGWRLDLDDLVLARGTRTWKPSRLRVDLRGGGTAAERAYTLQASFLRVEDLAAIALLVPVEGGWQRQLAQWAPQGDLHDVRIEFGPNGMMRGGAHFSDFGVRASGRYPGVDGVDGDLSYANGEAVIHLATRDGSVNLNRLFREPVALNHLSGEVRLLRDVHAWLLSSDGLMAGNNDVRLSAALTLRLPDKGAPFLDLRGDFEDGRAEAVQRYIPAHIMPGNAVAWLDRAFKKGKIGKGHVLVHGRLDQFPFDHGEGRFEVRFDVEDVDLEYMPQWPRLGGVSGHVVFDGRSMNIKVGQARLSGGQVSKTTIEIPDLLHARLRVKGRVQGELNELLEYLRATRLAGPHSEVLARFGAGGPCTLDLAFEQPLSGRRNKKTTPGTVRGTVRFNGSRLSVMSGVEFTDVKGRLRFHNQRFTSNRMTAHLFGAPATIRVGAVEGEPATRVSLEGGAEMGALGRAFRIPLLAHLRGRTDWKGQLILPHGEGIESTLRLHSTTNGMEVQLPAPLAKGAHEKRPLSLSLWFSGPRKGEMELAYGERIASSLAWNEDGVFDKAVIHFGAEMPKLPSTRGYLITGRLWEFALDEWAAVLADLPGVTDHSIAPTRPLPVRLDMEELGMVSAASVGKALGSSGAGSFDGVLPPLQVSVKNLWYNRLSLGTLSLSSETRRSRLMLKELRLVSPNFRLTGSGEWLRGRKPHTDLTLKVTGKDLGAAARQLGIASVIDRGAFDLQTKLGWSGNPQAFELAKIEGSVKARIKDGTLTEVKPGAGRLLGLLSLQALPHRLMLDFGDLFDDGMRFRIIEGSFKLEDGDAFSEDLHMDALPAAVFVSGRTGLARRDFEQKITVIPDVSGTVPVAGMLALGPQIGAALLLVQQLFHKKIDEASKIVYTVTGGWDNPVVKRIDKKR